MASYFGGYPQERFQYPVDKNFFCPICTDVLKDSVSCHNQHYFCKACITKHLQNSNSCPICIEKLTEESLSKPPRIVTDYLNGLIINCDYSGRGCTEFLELGNLANHSLTCGYKPVTCPNKRCETIVNMKDLQQHRVEHCEYRLIWCQECDEEMSVKKYGKHACILGKEVNEMKAMLLEVKDEVSKISKNQNEKLNEVQHALDSKMNELLIKVHLLTFETECHDQELSSPQGQAMSSSSAEIDNNIMVLGGNNKISLCSVEKYSTRKKAWTICASTKQSRVSSTAHYYEGKVFVMGGHCNGSPVASIEYMDIRQGEWFPFVHPLPIKCHGHNSVIHNDRLWVIGGMLVKQPCSNSIYEMMLNPPYTSELKCRLQEPLAYHGSEVIGSNILILGGSTTGYPQDAVSHVSLYSTVQNRIRKVQTLPFPIMDMATVKHGDEVIIVGGRNQKNEILNVALAYNYKTYKCRQLPNMKHKRAECAAVISGNKVYVMGSFNWESKYLNSVECLDLENLIWEDLPPMNEAKDKVSAVIIPNFLY